MLVAITAVRKANARRFFITHTPQVGLSSRSAVGTSQCKLRRRAKPITRGQPTVNSRERAEHAAGKRGVGRTGGWPLPDFCVSAENKGLEVLCFDADVQVFILKEFGAAGDGGDLRETRGGSLEFMGYDSMV